MSVARFPQEDYEKNRVIGGLGYLVFFLPLLVCPDSRYGKFCANQGLIGLLAICALSLVGFVLKLVIGWIPLVGLLVRWAIRLARIAVSCVMLYYAYLAICKNDTRKIPYVDYTFIS